MLSWFKKKTPKKPETYGQQLDVEFSNASGNWNETVNLLDLLEKSLQAKGYSVRRDNDTLTDQQSGFVLKPEFLALDPGDNGVQSSTLTTISHPTLMPDGLFEYQHSAGKNLESSLSEGFNLWEQTDFSVLLESQRTTPENCTHMEMKFPSGKTRRVLFGPVAHMVDDREAHEAGSQCSADGDEHPYCPCCLFTQSIAAFKPLIESDQFCALRLFAMRGGDGSAESDCRVNGHDDKKGMSELRKYVKTWPQAGFEFRKQYVVLQTV